VACKNLKLTQRMLPRSC